jgi:putative two-component system response regulator
MNDPLADKPSILIVDDLPANLKILGNGLQDEFDVRVATSGEDCLAACRGEPRPELVLLDAIMPGMDGFQVCEILHADKATAGIPVIFITAMDDHVNEEKGLRLGAVDYITRPFSLPVVRARLRIHLELKRHREFVELLLERRTDDLQDAHQELLRRFGASPGSD